MTKRISVACLSSLLVCFAANAEVVVCNDFAEEVLVAIGWVESGDTLTKGWWTVKPRSCVQVDGRPLRSPHYVHARTRTHVDRMYRSWGGEVKLAVDTANDFSYVHSQSIAPNDKTGTFTDLGKGRSGVTKATYRILPDGVHSLATYD